MREVKGASFGGFFEGLEVDPFLGMVNYIGRYHFQRDGAYMASWFPVWPTHESSKSTNRFHLPFSSGKKVNMRPLEDLTG